MQFVILIGELSPVSELPSNLILKKASPKVWLPLLTMVWGIITMCLGFVRNFAGFVAVRSILGIAEGGLLPGMVHTARTSLNYSRLILLGAVSSIFL
jgi:hypothetical protein